LRLRVRGSSPRGKVHAQALRSLAKQIGKQALGLSGTTVAHDEIHAEAQYADLRHEPDPARTAERDQLGLLGRLAAVLCLLEIYGHAPSAEEFRACLAKHIAYWQQRARTRKRRQKREIRTTLVAPFLWIIAAGAPMTLLTKLQVAPPRGWPAGVYFFGDDVLRVGIVVTSRLPRDRSTLLVRLMAAGPLLAPAIEELRALPPGAHERTVAEQILLKLRSTLGHKPKRTRKEQEFIVAMQKSWEDARAEGRTEGRAEGRAETQANAILTVLRVRGIAVPEGARKRILAQKDLHQLERWHEKAIVATSLGDVMGEVIDDRGRGRSTKTVRLAAHKERSGRRSPRVPAQR
jgi:hypothetical protein